MCSNLLQDYEERESLDREVGFMSGLRFFIRKDAFDMLKNRKDLLFKIGMSSIQIYCFSDDCIFDDKNLMHGEDELMEIDFKYERITE